MEYSLARNWWILALRGVLALLFGVLAFVWPAMLWLAVVVTFAAYALVDGVFAIGAAVSGHGRGRHWWALALQGVVGIAAGVLALAWPGITEMVLLFFIAWWAIVTGVLAIMAAVRLRREVQGEWALALSGVLSVLFGLALLALPGPGALAVAWLIASYALVYGAVLLILAFRLRRLAGPMHARVR